MQNILQISSLQMGPKSFQVTLSVLSKNDLPDQKRCLLLELMSQHMGKRFYLNSLLSLSIQKASLILGLKICESNPWFIDKH